MTRLTSTIYTGYIDRDGQWHEHTDGNVRVRYDEHDKPWCLRHGCPISLCKQNHLRGERRRLTVYIIG